MKISKKQMADQMEEHSRSLLSAVKKFNELSAVDEDNVNSLRKQFEPPYTGLNMGIFGDSVLSYQHVHENLQALHVSPTSSLAHSHRVDLPPGSEVQHIWKDRASCD